MGSFVLLKLSGDSAVMNSLKPRDANRKRTYFVLFVEFAQRIIRQMENYSDGRLKGAYFEELNCLLGEFRKQLIPDR